MELEISDEDNPKVEMLICNKDTGHVSKLWGDKKSFWGAKATCFFDKFMTLSTLPNV